MSDGRIWIVMEFGRDVKIMGVFQNPDSARIKAALLTKAEMESTELPLKRYEVEAHRVQFQAG